MKIHQTAQVSPKAELAGDVEVGAFSIIGDGVKIGSGTHIFNNVTIFGPTTIGKNNVIHPYAVLGGAPQDLSYKGEPTALAIGDGNTFRECVTANRGTAKDVGKTVIGSNNYIMACSHIAHDCILEDNIIMANATLLGGHIKIENDAVIGGQVCIHHFATIGAISFIGGGSSVAKDVPPYMLVQGSHAKVRSVNVVGLKRKGISAQTILLIKDAFKLIWRSGAATSEAIEKLAQQNGHVPEIKKLTESLANMGKSPQGRAREAARSW